MTGHRSALVRLFLLVSIESIACNSRGEGFLIFFGLQFQRFGVSEFLVFAELFEDFDLGDNKDTSKSCQGKLW